MPGLLLGLGQGLGLGLGRGLELGMGLGRYSGRGVEWSWDQSAGGIEASDECEYWIGAINWTGAAPRAWIGAGAGAGVGAGVGLERGRGRDRSRI